MPLALARAVNRRRSPMSPFDMPEKMRQRIGGAEAADRRLRDDAQVGGDDWDRDRHVKSIGDADGEERRVLTHVGVDVVDGRDDVLPAAEQLRVVVREHRGHRVEIEIFDRVERETLKGEPERGVAGADGIGALGENRAEAPGAPLKHAGARIELIGESGCRRRQRHRHELADEGRAELAEVALEVAVEMGGMRLLSRQRRLAVEHQPSRAEEVREQRGGVLDGHCQVERLLRVNRLRRGEEHRDSSSRTTDANICTHHYRPISTMTQLPLLLASVMVCRLSGDCRRPPASMMSCLLSCSGRPIAAPIDRLDGDVDFLRRDRAKPLLDPAFLVGTEVGLDRSEEREILRLDRARIRGHDAREWRRRHRPRVGPRPVALRRWSHRLKAPV